MNLNEMNLMKIFNHFENPMTEAHSSFMSQLMDDKIDLTNPTHLARFQALQQTASALVTTVTGITKKESDTVMSVNSNMK